MSILHCYIFFPRILCYLEASIRSFKVRPRKHVMGEKGTSPDLHHGHHQPEYPLLADCSLWSLVVRENRLCKSQGPEWGDMDVCSVFLKPIVETPNTEKAKSGIFPQKPRFLHCTAKYVPKKTQFPSH